ncbi:hypothetical protein K8352_19145 [Flavobacteriaceae bacterium F89]|uniref:Uncharacterized protein n=1 Tax=Cerina litoralis TaxID=2874477 RepID=A0AAE3JV03_9FLAO|nr:hypothetical protein [Cerina litoralis]MCG2462887.1 hypothetical protein [Cerina litoralis]
MENPSKIEEGGVTYSLGTFDGKRVFYDFPKILVYLEAKGKRLFGRDFTLQEKDREMLLKLSNYFIRDLENCEKDGIDSEKGILLTGSVG